MKQKIDSLLEGAVLKEASDLHITVNSPPVYRVHGRLITDEIEFITSTDSQKMAQAIMGDEDWKLFVEKGEYDFSYEIKNVARFRINVFRQKQTISIAARVIPNDVPSIHSLGLPIVLNKIAKKTQGLFLVTGPTGSGKSSTLAAMIDYINQKMNKHIITLEDPIEFLHQHKRSIIQQREIGTDTETFAKGLRAALRQDPDVILVGEMRDLETISTAITAAETGHFVLATLHTNSASETINRIIDVFPGHQQQQIRIQLASVLEAILSQRLLIKADHSGRTVATELLINLPSVANLIRSEKVEQIQNVMQTNVASGMHTLEMSIRKLIENGEIKKEDGQVYL